MADKKSDGEECFCPFQPLHKITQNIFQYFFWILESYEKHKEMIQRLSSFSI